MIDWIQIEQLLRANNIRQLTAKELSILETALKSNPKRFRKSEQTLEIIQMVIGEEKINLGKSCEYLIVIDSASDFLQRLVVSSIYIDSYNSIANLVSLPLHRNICVLNRRNLAHVIKNII